MTAATRKSRDGRTRARLFSSTGANLVRIASSLAITFFGLLLVTFLIGRVLPIDPVLAAVGDHASEQVISEHPF